MVGNIKFEGNNTLVLEDEGEVNTTPLDGIAVHVYPETLEVELAIACKVSTEHKV
jgi:hypothetical protein